MNKEKIDLSKPKKEYKKFQKESESLVDELKIDKEEQEDEILEEELEAKFWRDLYKEKLEEVKDDEDFKEAAISDLEDKIKSGKNGDGWNANWALRNISAYKNFGIFKKEADESLEEVLDDEEFKKTVISDLEDDIKSGRNGHYNNAHLALKTISAYKNLGVFEKVVEEKLEQIKNDKDFKKTVISSLEDKIKSGKNGDGWNANRALRSISSYKNLGIFDSETGEGLKEILDDKDFKKVAINDLEGDIKSGKNGDGADANWAFWTISAYKDVSEYFKDLADQKIAKKARKEDKGDNIPKRPEIK